MPGKQKSLVGTVVSDKMEKTVAVVVQSTTRHRLYHKTMRRSKRFLAHDDLLGAKEGDLVRILESRPLSRRKRWRVAEIIQRREVAEIAPREIDAEYLGRPREREAEPEIEAPSEEAPAAEAPGEAPAGVTAAEATGEAPAEATAAEAAPEAEAAAPDGEEGSLAEAEQAAEEEKPPEVEEPPAAEETSTEDQEQEREEP